MPDCCRGRVLDLVLGRCVRDEENLLGHLSVAYRNGWCIAPARAVAEFQLVHNVGRVRQRRDGVRDNKVHNFLHGVSTEQFVIHTPVRGKVRPFETETRGDIAW